MHCEIRFRKTVPYIVYALFFNVCCIQNYTYRKSTVITVPFLDSVIGLYTLEQHFIFKETYYLNENILKVKYIGNWK